MRKMECKMVEIDDSLIRYGDKAGIKRLLDEMFGGEVYEMFYLIYVNGAGLIYGYDKISEGSRMMVDVRLTDVLRSVSIGDAKGVILAHNHVYGDMEVSKEDIKMTKEIREFLSMYGIKVYNHVIYGGKKIKFMNKYKRNSV